MASTTARGDDGFGQVLTDATEIPNTHLEPPPSIHSRPTPSTPLEMTRLEPRPRSSSPEKSQDITIGPHAESSRSDPPDLAQSASVPFGLGVTTSSPPEPSTLSANDNVPQAASPTPGVPLTAQATNPAIGPASDHPTPTTKESDSTGPTLVMTLLLPTGARHPYKMDEKYLKKRNVDVADNNPIHMSVYTLKELIWREWREDWELRPSSPSAIRLIHFGKLLDDKTSLEDAKFKNDVPNVVHMTVKPQDIVDEEDAKLAKQGGRDRDGNERSPGCRCVLM